jgi:hypothetical protein
MMRLARVLATVSLLALATACAPHGELGVAPASAADASAPANAPASPDPAPVQPAAPVAAPSPTALPSTDLLACTTDTDCAVKDVGSCCGARPACVRADAKTFPEQVKARCASEGRVSTCAFTAIEGCTCSAGRCAPIVASPGPTSPQPVQ